MSVSEFALITLDEMKSFPGFAGLASAEEPAVEALIDAATLDFEKEWDNYGVRRADIVERALFRDILEATPRGNVIELSRYPIASVASIVDPARNTVLATEYWIDINTGRLYTSGSWPMPIDENGFATYWTVTYTAGRVADTASVPANIKTACKMWVSSLYRRTDRDLISKKIGDLTLTYASGGGSEPGGLPATIKSMIAGWKKTEV